MNAQSHLEKIKSKLAGATTIAQITVVQEYALQDRGFFRARLVLTNGDFVEVSEFFTIVGGQARLVEYRHQWMDSSQQILRSSLVRECNVGTPLGSQGLVVWVS